MQRLGYSKLLYSVHTMLTSSPLGGKTEIGFLFPTLDHESHSTGTVRLFRAGLQFLAGKTEELPRNSRRELGSSYRRAALTLAGMAWPGSCLPGCHAPCTTTRIMLLKMRAIISQQHTHISANLLQHPLVSLFLTSRHPRAAAINVGFAPDAIALGCRRTAARQRSKIESLMHHILISLRWRNGTMDRL